MTERTGVDRAATERAEVSASLVSPIAEPVRSGRKQKTAPLAGIREHRHPVRVYYEDTDASGIVYHTGYLRFAERARTELLRGLGYEQASLAAEVGVVFAVRRCNAEFMAPARLDEALEVVSTIDEVGGATVMFTQRVCRDGKELVRLDVRLACMTPAGRPARIPAEIRSAFDAGRLTPGRLKQEHREDIERPSRSDGKKVLRG